MRDDIPALLRDAAADPSRTPDFDALAARGRRQHLTGRAATALVALLAVVAGGVVLWPDQPDRGPVIGSDPSPTEAADEEPPTSPGLPPGWLEIRLGDARLGVPEDWTIETFTEPAAICSSSATSPTAFVLEQGRDLNTPCAGVAPQAVTLEVVPLSRRDDDGGGWTAFTTDHGLDGERRVANPFGDLVTYRFKQVDLWLQFSGPEALDGLDERILATLARVDGPASRPVSGSLTSPRPVPDHPDPVVRAGAAGTKVDCQGPVHLGGWALDAGGSHTGTAEPRDALEMFLAESLFAFGLPDEGYDQVASEPGRMLFTYLVDGRAKVAVVVADGTAVEEQVNTPNGWGFEVFASCDPAEFAPGSDDELDQTVWTDRDGNRVPTSTITTMAGAEHCDWQSITFLQLNDRQYLRDPQHLLAESTVQPYDPDAQLPTDAVDTGYRRGDHQLWLSPDSTIAYLVTNNGVEAWPSTTDMVGCR